MNEKRNPIDQGANDKNTGPIKQPYKEYFPPTNEQGAQSNRELNQFGYTFLSYPQGTHVSIPEGLLSTQVSPQIFDEVTIAQKIIYDPNRAKVETIIPTDPKEAKNTRKVMEEKGWILADSNIVGDIYVQTINK